MDKEKVARILRSLIISSNPQDGMHLSELLSDFKKFEGFQLPLFEYKTVHDFLLASGKFDIKADNRGDLIINARTAAESNHVSQLVCETNRARARRLANPPHRISSSVQSRLSTFRTKRSSIGMGPAERCTNSIVNSQQQNKFQPHRPPHQRNGMPSKEFSFEQLKQNYDEQQRKRVPIEDIQTILKEVSQPSVLTIASTLKLTGNNDDKQRKQTPTFEVSEVKSELKTQHKNARAVEEVKLMELRENEDDQQYKITPPIVSLDQLQTALKEVSQRSVLTIASTLKLTGNNDDKQRKQAPTIEVSEVKSELNQHCDEQQRKDVRSIEEVKLEPKEEEAQQSKEAPSIASIVLWPKYNVQSEKKEQSTHPSVSSVSSEHTENEPNQPSSFTLRTDIFAVICTDDDDLCIEYQHMNKLELPWQDEYWPLLITCCTSTTDVWGQLSGTHYRFNPSAIEFQKDMLAKSKIATVFNVGQIYLTISNDIGHRIRLDSVDYVTKQILCFFVDNGYKKWLEMNQIYNCSSLSMYYPPQAICFSLDGLEGLPIRNVRKCLEKTLLNQLVTGQIITKEEDFVLPNESNATEAVIKAAFYDTSNGSFVNLHQEIVQQLYEDITVPELTKSNLTPVTISNIADNGDIFCQLQSNSVHYVNKLIKEFVRQVSNNPFLPAAKKIGAISKKNPFVVYDNETKKLYRAKVISEKDGGMQMFFIDYGKIKIVPVSMMYCVECPNHEISKFPPQAIRTKLSGVSKAAIERSVTKLRNRFSLNGNAYVKSVQSNTIVPEVKLYFDAESFMVCLNDSIKMEIERDQLIATSHGTRSQSNFHDFPVPKVCATPKANSDNFSIEGVKCMELSGNFAGISRPKIETFQPPKLNSRFEIVIVQSESPSNFVIKPIEYMSQWQNQMKVLQIYCKSSSATLPLDTIKEGEPYACLKSNGYWYRAFIKFHRSKMYAFFCDIADIDNVSDASKIKFLPMEYRIIPKLAMTARLFGIQPVNGTWELDDKVQFRRITKGKKFEAIVAKVMYNEKNHDNSILEVKLEYKSHVINDLFVQSERAVYTLEDIELS